MRSKFPYGISNFQKLMTEFYLFVDKTIYIERLENLSSQYNFLLRPRRFGKSLFVSMLIYYYDLAHKAMFEQNFGELYIGKNPTPKASSYLVLNFEFSRIDTTTPESTFKGFLRNIQSGFTDFFSRYDTIFSSEDVDFVMNATAPNEAILSFIDVYKKTKPPLPIYLLIDEYDHFANEIIAFRFDDFANIVSRNGFVRKFYEALKTATMEGVVDRIFITGVTPVTMDSLTSGFNIGTDLSMHPFFNECLGFNIEEVKALVEIACQHQDCDKERIYKDLKEWYNGYRFVKKELPSVYNSDMVLYFLDLLQQRKEYPDRLLDVNIASDYGKIKKIFDLKNVEGNYTALDELVTTGSITSDITQKFNFEKEFTRTDFISLLYYLGFISIKEADMNEYVLQMPNYVIKVLYFDFFREVLSSRAESKINYEPVNVAIRAMAKHGDISLFAQEVQKILKKLSNRDTMQFSEKHLKAVMFTLLNFSKAYYIKSEYETEKKYIDILLLERKPIAVNYQYAFELKYLPKEKAKQKSKLKKEAIAQLKTYLEAEEMKQLKNLKSYVMLIVGDTIEFNEVVNQ